MHYKRASDYILFFSSFAHVDDREPSKYRGKTQGQGGVPNFVRSSPAPHKATLTRTDPGARTGSAGKRSRQAALQGCTSNGSRVRDAGHMDSKKACISARTLDRLHIMSSLRQMKAVWPC